MAEWTTHRKIVGARIRELRATADPAANTGRGIYQRDLAKALGRHPTWVSRVEGGYVNLTVEDVTKIALFFGVDTGTLMRGLLPRGRKRRRRKMRSDSPDSDGISGVGEE